MNALPTGGRPRRCNSKPGNRTPAVPVLRIRLRSLTQTQPAACIGAGSLGPPCLAARWYSWMSPPSTSTRSIGPVRGGTSSGAAGDLEVDPTVRAGAVVVIDVGRKHALEMTTVPDQDPVKALSPHGAHPSLRVHVCPRGPSPASSRHGHRRPRTRCRSCRRTCYPDPGRAGKGGWRAPRAPRSDCGLLGHPRAGRVSSHPAKPPQTTLELNEEQDVHPGE